MMEAEKTAIMNQILYVVKNMIIFEFTEKDVKTFSNRFSKILKQDEKCLKDIHVRIWLFLAHNRKCSQRVKGGLPGLKHQVVYLDPLDMNHF